MTRVASKAAWSSAKVSTIALALSFVLLAPSHVTLAQTPEAYSKEAMTQALATKHRYDLYGIRFDSDKAEIQRGDNALLDDVAAAMKSFPEWRLRITGHTDSSGDKASNEVLSTDRANAVKQALIERGIDAARLEALGMGDRQPVASNDTPEKRAFNRRVELARLDVTTAGDAEAKKLLKAMSDFLAAQKAISFAYDTNYEVVTKDSYKLALASSGTIELSRPDKVRATRAGGFANVETVFDGQDTDAAGQECQFLHASRRAGDDRPAFRRVEGEAPSAYPRRRSAFLQCLRPIDVGGGRGEGYRKRRDWRRRMRSSGVSHQGRSIGRFGSRKACALTPADMSSPPGRSIRLRNTASRSGTGGAAPSLRPAASASSTRRMPGRSTRRSSPSPASCPNTLS